MVNTAPLATTTTADDSPVAWSIDLFNVLDPRRHPLHRTSHGRGAAITETRDHYDVIYILERGSVRLYRLSSEGQDFTLLILYAGEPFVLRSSDQAEVLCDDTVLYHVPRACFIQLVCAHPELVPLLYTLFDHRLTAVLDRLEDVALGSVATRLGRLMVRLGRQCPGNTVTVTHADLARLIGTRREEVTKTLSVMRDRGLIAYRPHGREITICDADGLSLL